MAKVKAKNLFYGMLPNKKDKKKLMADSGMSVDNGGPTPPDPRIKQMMKTLPDNYFDIFGGQPQRSQVQAPHQLATLGPSEPIHGVFDQPQLSNPGTSGPAQQQRPPTQIPRRNPATGNAIQLGLLAIDAAIPRDKKIYNQQVERPLEGYNPYPRGTGSQALADGGQVDGQQPPVKVTDPKDPRLKKYNDSLAYHDWANKFEQNHIKKGWSLGKPVSPEDHRVQFPNWTDPSGVEKPVAFGHLSKANKTGGIDDSWFGEYPKPVQPYSLDKGGKKPQREVFQKKMMFDPYNVETSGEAINIPETGLRPQQPIGQDPTNYSFTGRDDQGQQTTRYLSDLDTWKRATDMMGYRNREVTNNGQEAHAAGYQFANGGVMMSLERDEPMLIPEGVGDNTPMAKNGNWIKGAVNPAHKGYCTPMTKSTCTGRRKAFAKTMKKHHGFHKKDNGGTLQYEDLMAYGGIIPDNMSNFSPHKYDSGGFLEHIMYHPNAADMVGYYEGGSVRGGSDTTDMMENILFHPSSADMRGFHDGGFLENIMFHPNAKDMEGWDKAKAGKKLSPAKAREILHDGTAQGHAITDKQRKYFGAVASGYAAAGLPIPGTEGDIPKLSPQEQYYRSSAELGYFKEQLNSKLKAKNPQAYTDYFKGLSEARKTGKEDDYIQSSKYDAYLSPDEVKGTLGKNYNEYLNSLKSVNTHDVSQGQKPLYGNTEGQNDVDKLNYGRRFASLKVTPSLSVHDNSGKDYSRNYSYDPDKGVSYTETGDKSIKPSYVMADGGVMYDDGGSVGTMWGGNVEQISNNPHDGGTMQFNGQSHDNGGIGMHYNGNPVEVEGGETASKDSQGNLNIYGNMYLPGTKTKFKSVAKEIGQKEKRYDYLKSRGSELVNNSNPANKFEKMAFNAGRAMMSGGSVGQKDLAEKKENLAHLQRAMLDTAEEHGLDPQEMSKGNIKKAKKGAYIQIAADGAQIGPEEAKKEYEKDKVKFQKILDNPKAYESDHEKAKAFFADPVKYYKDSTSLFKGTGNNPTMVDRESSILKFLSSGENRPVGDPNDPTRADRNKNPGNIKYGDWAKAHGASGQDKDGFAIFDNKDVGLGAMKSLLQSKDYNNLSVKDAINKWTGGKPYRYSLGDTANKKVGSLSESDFNTVLGEMTKGEGTKYGSPTRSTPPAPVPTRPPARPITPYGLPDIPLTPDSPQVHPDKVVPPELGNIPIPDKKNIPSNVEPLHMNEVLGELYGAATNKVEPVAMQHYRPELYTPYQVSFQDRLNQNQSSYNALQRTLGSTNPNALGAIAAQKYAADSGVKGEEFRTNQAISNDITNRNISLNNDAQLKNLQLADTQFVRQSEAKSKTREQNQMIVNSLSSKYAQNQLENKRLAVYENLYDYRFVPKEQGGLDATYMGPNAVFNYNQNGAARQNAQDSRTVSNYDQYGNLKGYRTYGDSQLKEQKEALELEMQRRKLPLLSTPPL